MSTGDLHIGMRPVWGGAHEFGISAADRRRHLYVIGQTGTGKSTLLRNLIAQDIAGGEGLALIDPHGDLALEVLDLVPAHRIDDVVFLDPSDLQHVIGFNPFYRVLPDDQPLVAANTVAAFRHVWADSWGPRLEYILYNAVAAILGAPDSMRPSFLAIPRLLVEREYRERVLAGVSDARVQSFFHQEFDSWGERQMAEALSSVQNKIGQVISNPAVRNVISQWRPTLDLSVVMRKRQILIVRLPKGTLGADPANLLGSLLVTGLLQAAMRRETTTDRTAFHLYIDEFQNFTTEAFASILSEARKYALTLTIGHQYLSQLLPSVRDAVLGNVGNIISFRVGADDAEVMARECGDFSEDVFRDLMRGQVIARLTQEAAVTQAFRGLVQDQGQPFGTRAKVLAKSRRTYAVPRLRVEESIAAWLRPL